MATPYYFREYVIREDMVESLELYVEHGRLPGDFLQAVLRNDLADAAARADEDNLHNLAAFAGWLYNECPGLAWGSAEKVAAWAGRFRTPEE